MLARLSEAEIQLRWNGESEFTGQTSKGSWLKYPELSQLPLTEPTGTKTPSLSTVVGRANTVGLLLQL